MMTKQEIKEGYGICGLVCGLCSYNINCAGCRCKTGECDVKACCVEKGLSYCFECDEYPCDKDMHKGKRSRAFNAVAKAEGLDKLAEYLHINYERGITYHRADKLPGDYDRCKTVEEVTELLKNGKPDPYDVCPTYESERFILRLVSMDDAEDLLECYAKPTVSVQANAEGCTYGYGSQTVAEMQECIRRWLVEYKNRCFIRFSIVDKQKDKSVGTIEIFDNGRGANSVLRIDVMCEDSSQYENEGCLSELLKICDSFFHDMECEQIVTKAMPEAAGRINALLESGYLPYPKSSEWEWEHCYIKKKS